MASVTLQLLDDSLSDADGLVRCLTLDGEELVLGRSDVTGITDKRCSRNHLKISLDRDSNEIIFQQMGSNPSGVLFRQEEITLQKHNVKRFPCVDAKNSDKDVGRVYLIHKDKKYGYSISVSMDNGTASDSQKKVEIKAKSSTHGKRKSSTLDDFIVTKKPKSEAPTKGSWKEIEKNVFYYTTPNMPALNKVAAFDMDGTIITTASGAKWPKDKDDWKFLYPDIPDKLRRLSSEGYSLVMFTNQGSIASGSLKPAVIQQKIECIIDKVATPIQAIIAGCKHGLFRKPLPGMWDYILANGAAGVDVSSSFYVGDAAGRPANWQPGKKKDFACSDRLFALNIGIQFYTPETYFLGAKEASFEMPEFEPESVLRTNQLTDPPNCSLVSAKPELVVMVGFPGSGKSYFSKHHLSGHQRVSRDELGSWQKCVAKCESHLKAGASVVIDNTNPDVESRARYVSVADKYKIPARCFLMTTTYKHARHNEKYRQLTDKTHKPIPDMVVHSYKSKYKEPELSEGFTQLVRVNFIPKFSSDKDKKLYLMYHLEK